MKQIKTDAVVVGAGPAGLAAALELGAAGRQVVILEKEGKAGGLREGGIGPFGVESFLQKNAFVDLTREAAFNYFMEFTHWKTDARLVSEYINLSGDTIDWLDEMGVQFTGVSAYYVGGKPTQHNVASDAPKITQVMYQKCLTYPTLQFLFHTAGKSLLTKDGAVVGVQAEDENGEPFQVEAKAVIVSSGGFGGDPELVAQQGFTKGKDLFYTFEFPCLTGDGLRMIWAAGGAKAPMMMDTYIGLPRGYGGPLGTAPALAGLRQYNLMVNLKGQRFMREDLMANPSYAGNAVHRQPEGCAIMLLDSTIYEAFQAEDAKNARHRPGPPPPKPGDPPRKPEPFERFQGPMEDIMREAIENGSPDFFIADSLEELAQQAGLPQQALLDTVAEYNRLCEAKLDTIFHKAPEFLQPIRGPKFYAARFCCDTYGGLGGVRINYRAQVLDEAEEPIPGLYAAGNDANTVYGDSYPFYFCGNTSGFALNSGRIAGKNAAALMGD
jgi:fumarate reductase flavoprotein subunit